MIPRKGWVLGWVEACAYVALMGSNILQYLAMTPFCLQYHGYQSDHMSQVIFYSWSSNWGAEHFGGVRISFPDPSTVSVIADFERTPNGSLAVDYPDVSLVKLISRDLFEKAPEAYWMLSRLTIGPGRLLELLRSTQPTASHDALTQTACSFLKGHVHDLVQVVAPPCVTGVAGAAADVFDVTSGMCAAPSSIDNFKCFEDEQPSLYRSKTVIRLGQRDWLSHDLMRTITGMLLSEKLGYSVRYEDITSVVSKVAWTRM